MSEQYITGKWYYDNECKGLIDYCIASNKPIFVLRTDITFNKSTDTLISHSCTACQALYEYVMNPAEFRNYMKISGFYFACYSEECSNKLEINTYLKKLFNVELMENPRGFISYGAKNEYFIKPCWIAASGGQWTTPQDLITTLQSYTTTSVDTFTVKFVDDYGTKYCVNQQVGKNEDAIPPQIYPPNGNQMFEKWDPSYKKITQKTVCKSVFKTFPDVEDYGIRSFDDYRSYDIFREKMISYDRNAPVLKNKFHCDLNKVLTMARREGVPLMAVWTSNCTYEFCSHCTALECVLLQPTFRQWMEQSNMYFYFGDANQGSISKDADKNGSHLVGPSTDGQEGYRGTSFYWCRPGTIYESAAYPFVRLYWEKDGKILVDHRTSGGYLIDETGNKAYYPGQVHLQQTPREDPSHFIYESDWLESTKDYQTYYPLRLYPNGRLLRDEIADIQRGFFKDYYITEEITEEKFKVTFKYGDDIISEQTVKRGESAVLPYEPQKIGYVFTGWKPTFTNITKDTVCIAQFSKISLPYRKTINEVNRDTTLFNYCTYGIYYTVTFQDYNGIILKTEEVKKGNDATPPDNPSRNGYSFSGWSSSHKNITKNTICVAQYTENKYTYDIKKIDMISEYKQYEDD